MKRLLSVFTIFIIVWSHCNLLVYAEGENTANVAKIGDIEYSTLESAISNANTGDNIILLKDINATAPIVITKSITLDLNGFTINSEQLASIKIQANNACVKNGTINNTYSAGTYAYTIYIYDGSVTIDNCKVLAPNAYTSIRITKGNNSIKNSTLTSKSATIISKAGNLNIENCNVTATTDKRALRIETGKATVKGSTLSSKNLTVESLNGSADITDSTIKVAEYIDDNKAIYVDSTASNGLAKEIIIGRGTVVENADIGIGVFNAPDTIVKVYGTVKGSSFGIASNGLPEVSGAKINVYEGANITGSTAMYLPSINGVTNIYGGTITGSKTAVEVRGGTLNINGGTLTSNASNVSSEFNENGTTIVGAALGVSPHTHGNNINVDIKGGSFKAKVPLYEINTNPTSCTGTVAMVVSNGTFTSTGDKTIISSDCRNYITGGTYTHDVTNFVKTDYGCKNVNGRYEVKHSNHTGGTATCTSKAICSICNESYGEVNTNNHNFESNYTIDRVATCGEEGIKSKHCTRCNAKTDVKKISKLEHNWGNNWTTVKDPTTTKEGKKERECLNGCGYKQYEIINKINEIDQNTNVQKNIEISEDAPEMMLNTNKDVLLDNLFTEEEKAIIENGENAKVWLEVSTINETEIEETDKTLIENNINQKIGEDAQIQYLDLNLFKKVGNNESIQIHEPGMKISLTITIPDEMINTNDMFDRKYSIARLHNGQVEILSGNFDSKTNEFTFKTDKFSTYALVYNDIKKENYVSKDKKDDAINNINSISNAVPVVGNSLAVKQAYKQPNNKQNVTPVETGDTILKEFIILVISVMLYFILGKKKNKHKHKCKH